MNRLTISELLLGYSKKDRGALLKTLVGCALLMAIAVVCKAVLVVSVPMLGVEGQEINVGYAIIMFTAILYGPLWGAAVGFGSDFLGFLIDSNGGGYAIGIGLTNILIGFITGIVMMIFRERMKKIVVLAPTSFILLTTASLHNSLWIAVIYGFVSKPYWTYALPRLGFSALINFPLNAFVLYILLNRVVPILQRAGLVKKTPIRKDTENHE